MHIAYFAPALPSSGSANGIVTYVRLMRDAMCSLGHRVTVVAGDEIERANGEVEQVRTSRFSDPIVSLLKAAIQDGAEIAEIEDSFGFASRIGGRGIPVVMRLHGPHCYGREVYETPAEKKASDQRANNELKAIAKVSAVTCPSQALWEALGKDGIQPHIGRVIPNPMPVPETRWTGGDPDQVLFVGRFDHRKGADIALAAFSKAREQRPSLRMVMVGEDRGVRTPDGSTVHFSPCEGVTFLGLQPAARIAELRKQSGLALCTSRFETFSYAVAEALALGMPVISSRCFGPPEMILDRGGILVPVGDAEATAHAILGITSNPELAAQMGIEGRKNVAQLLDPKKIARQTVNLYCGERWHPRLMRDRNYVIDRAGEQRA